MNKKQWQEQHGLTDEEMELVSFALPYFNSWNPKSEKSKITKVDNKRLDYENVAYNRD